MLGGVGGNWGLFISGWSKVEELFPINFTVTERVSTFMQAKFNKHQVALADTQKQKQRTRRRNHAAPRNGGPVGPLCEVRKGRCEVSPPRGLTGWECEYSVIIIVVMILTGSIHHALIRWTTMPKPARSLGSKWGTTRSSGKYLARHWLTRLRCWTTNYFQKNNSKQNWTQTANSLKAKQKPHWNMSRSAPRANSACRPEYTRAGGSLIKRNSHLMVGLRKEVHGLGRDFPCGYLPESLRSHLLLQIPVHVTHVMCVCCLYLWIVTLHWLVVWCFDPCASGLAIVFSHSL